MGSYKRNWSSLLKPALLTNEWTDFLNSANVIRQSGCHQTQWNSFKIPMANISGYTIGDDDVLSYEKICQEGNCLLSILSVLTVPWIKWGGGTNLMPFWSIHITLFQEDFIKNFYKKVASRSQVIC